MQEKQSRNDVVASALQILRRIRKAVQITPFVYVFCYLVILVLYNTADELVLDILDDLFYASPLVIFANLVFSKILKLCIWHKVACLLPLLPEIANLCDPIIFEWRIEPAIALNGITVVTSIIFFIAAYKVFFCDGR